jgi:hypothetical protein
MPWKTAIGATLILTLASGCSGATERTLITQFFASSRLRDLTALHGLATIVFEPATDGIITSFDLLGVSVVQSDQERPVLEEVSISAPVKLPDGRTVRKAFVITMQRGDAAGDPARGTGWMITAIKAGLESPSTPRS